MIRKILLGYDDSEWSKKALEFTLDLAEKYHAQAFVVSVARPPEIGDDVETEAIVENSRRYHQQILTSVKHRAAARGMTVHCEVVVGHPAEQIIYAADRHRVDLIVLGHRGKTVFQRLLIGSISKQVLQHASQPVLVVR